MESSDSSMADNDLILARYIIALEPGSDSSMADNDNAKIEFDVAQSDVQIPLWPIMTDKTTS